MKKYTMILAIGAMLALTATDSTTAQIGKDSATTVK